MTEEMEAQVKTLIQDAYRLFTNGKLSLTEMDSQTVADFTYFLSRLTAIRAMLLSEREQRL